MGTTRFQLLYVKALSEVSIGRVSNTVNRDTNTNSRAGETGSDGGSRLTVIRLS